MVAKRIHDSSRGRARIGTLNSGEGYHHHMIKTCDRRRAPSWLAWGIGIAVALALGVLAPPSLAGPTTIKLGSRSDLLVGGLPSPPFPGFGYRLQAAGDVNGDGRQDFVVGAPAARNGLGAAYVVFGRKGQRRVNLRRLGRNGFKIFGPGTETGFARSVSGAGDVNADGRDDLLVGASTASPAGRLRAGAAFVIFGKRTRKAVRVSSLGRKGFVIVGARPADAIGSPVSALGDVNGDRFDDFAVGNEDGAYVLFGRRSIKPVDTASPFAGYPVLDSQEAAGPIAGAGDVNGDGRDDLIVTAPDGGISSGGEVFVVFGKRRRDAVDVRQLRGRGFRISGESYPGYVDPAYQPASRAGSAVSAAGDFNGDGLDDVVIGAPGFNNAAGAAYVVYGKRDLGDVSLGALGGGGFRVVGTRGRPTPHPMAEEEFYADDTGSSVSGGQDLNGDRRSDVVIGASGAFPGGRSNAGSTFVVFGRRRQASFDLAKATPRVLRFDGTAPGDVSGTPLAAIGDRDGDRRAEILVGSYHYRRGLGRNGLIFGVEAPRLRISRAPVSIDGLGVGRISVRCPPTEPRCRGVLTLRTARKLRVGNRRRRTRKVIGRARFSIRPGSGASARVRLTRSGRRLLRRRGRMRIRASAKLRNRTRSGTVTITLRRR